MPRQSIANLAHPDPGLEPFLASPIDTAMLWCGEYLKAPSVGRYCHIPDLLTQEAINLLDQLPFPDGHRCPDETLQAHPVAGPLIRTMGRMSLMNRYNPLLASSINSSLRLESGVDIALPPHQDFLDGHAVIFNWACVGELRYRIDGKPVKIDSNEITVINGAAELIAVKGLVVATDGEPQEYGFATPAHEVIGQGTTSRKRLLVYADGVATNACQIPA